MRDISVLTAALEIVERRLREPMNAADLAAACYLSYSGLQKLFGYAFGCSVSVYITKRRLSLASRALLESGASITDIAFDYQYGSPEAFSRAFKRFWGISPNKFRRTRRFTELQPKFIIERDQGGFNMLKRKPLDVSELYDELKKLGGTYVLSVDIAGFEKVNKNYGYAAGDAVIAETFARVERELGEDMLLFRIGGDEFAAVSRFEALADAEALARKITGMNGTSVPFEAHEIPLSLRIGICQIPTGGLSYQKALNILAESVEKTRCGDDLVAVL
ncbi:MAG: helix-turn-helix domain-containing protein [Defluviitaleaceae bacterium]|nr:helix-turn-helix domain-containing protein [Defluviitaleaceae bacterium]